MWRILERWTDRRQLYRVQLLAKVPLFSGLSQRQLGKLLVKLFERNYEAGETVFLQGDAGKALFIVLSGKVSIFRDNNETEEQLATLTAGGYFGELALIDDQPRFATARADEPTGLLMLYKTDFDDLIDGHKAIAIKVMSNLLHTLVGYVRNAQSHVGNRNSSVAGVISAKTKAG
ncbi:MAG: cyclic nucleotide-binding domain-containing protein [Deltaproteobacteria bacterium]|jgi:CRP-like cAMP-binding protein